MVSPGAAPADPLIGRTFGSYRVVQLIGAGGMGAVYLAEQPQIGKRVAIKVLHPLHARDPDVLARFFQEAQLVNQIRHDHLIDVLDFGHSEDGAPYLIMEVLEGEALSTRIVRGAMSEAAARHIGGQVARALAAAHAAGVIHRDLKPENVFLTRHGDDASFVKLLDFGIAKLANPSSRNGPGQFTGRRLTAVGSLIGTPLYMAPEQIRGAPVTPATDLYALGCVLHEMVTGVPPFVPPRPTIELLFKQHLEAEPPRISMRTPGVSEEYESLTRRCLAKDPADRPASAAEVAAELGRPAAGAAGPGAARPGGASARSERARSGRGGAALAPTAAVSTAGAAAGVARAAGAALAPSSDASQARGGPAPMPLPPTRLGAGPATRESVDSAIAAGSHTAPGPDPGGTKPAGRPSRALLVVGGGLLLLTGVLVGTLWRPAGRSVATHQHTGPSAAPSAVAPAASGPAAASAPGRPAPVPVAGATPTAPLPAAAVPPPAPAPAGAVGGRPTASPVAGAVPAVSPPAPAPVKFPVSPAIGGVWNRVNGNCPLRPARRLVIRQEQYGRLGATALLTPPYRGYIGPDGMLTLGNNQMICRGRGSPRELTIDCWIGALGRSCAGTYQRARGGAARP